MKTSNKNGKSNNMTFLIIVVVIGIVAYTHFKKEGTPTFFKELEGTVLLTAKFNPSTFPVGEWLPYTFILRDINDNPINIVANKQYYLYLNQTAQTYTLKDGLNAECQIAYSYVIDSTTYSECASINPDMAHFIGYPAIGYIRSTFTPKVSGSLKSMTVTMKRFFNDNTIISFVVTSPQSTCSYDGQCSSCSEFASVNNDWIAYKCMDTQYTNCQKDMFDLGFTHIGSGTCTAPTTTCNTPADTNCNGCVGDEEFPIALTNWKNLAGGITDEVFPLSLTKWQNQEGC